MQADLDPAREVYPNAPLQLVACEVAYTLAPSANVDEARDALYERLGDIYPIPAPPPGPAITFHLGPGGPQVAGQGFRFLDFERTSSVAVSHASIVIETSRYQRFEGFCERVVEAIGGLASVVRIVAAQRIGLRYIDEVPVAVLPSGDFDGYFTESVLAPGKLVPDVGTPAEFLTTSRFALGPGQHTTMRTGVLSTPVVTPEGPLSIARPTRGPYFLIDIDSSWEAGATTPPLPFDPSVVSDILKALHAPVRALFEHSITDKLRDDVLRKEPA